MLFSVALARTDVSDELIAHIISELGTTLAVIINFHLLVTTNIILGSLIIFTLMMETICSFETSVVTRATGRLIPEDGILNSCCRENRKSCMLLNQLRTIPCCTKGQSIVFATELHN
jgi:hypothetical protein